MASSFLAGGGEMGARMRALDWDATPLGPPEQWPQSLKTAVRIMLTSRQPIWIGWGSELIYLCNDPTSRSSGESRDYTAELIGLAPTISKAI
jgi:hypothetical protein